MASVGSGLIALARAVQAQDLSKTKAPSTSAIVDGPVLPSAEPKDVQHAKKSDMGADVRRNAVQDSESDTLMPLVGTMIAEHIHNFLPTHLIYIPESKVLGRAAMQNKVQTTIEEKVQQAVKAGKIARSVRVYSDAVKEFVHEALAYAIFSHRWLNEGEPTYQDVAKRTRRRKLFTTAGPGVRKVAGFCSIAQAEGYDWAWSDTCCIDKSSSSELDEAIRSMFRWYRNAKLCVVYLADVVGQSDMSRDAWFTRGWTLQELLASRRVKFYNKHWKSLTDTFDDKDTVADGGLRELLSDITEIPSVQLKYFSAGVDNFREKMYWASKRRTTRVEDAAYSLIGIFDVSLMTAYGEGERAFYRLQTAIMEKTNTLDIFIWNGYSSHDHSMIAHSPQCFANATLHLPRVLPWNYCIGDGDKHYMLDLSCFPVRGGTSFTLTNVGLRMDMILFDIFSDDAPPDSDFECTWEAGEFLEGRIIWRTSGEGDAPSSTDVFTAYLTPDYPRSEFQRRLAFEPMRHTVGILDYEWGEGNSEPEFLLQSLSHAPKHRADMLPDYRPPEGDRGDLDDLIVTAMRDCSYTAVFLMDSGRPAAEKRRLCRVAGSAIMRVRRPRNGWRREAETVFVL